MNKRFFKVFLLMLTVIVSTFVVGCGDEKISNNSSVNESDKLIIYTSMKESLIGGIVEGFKAKYPNVEVDYQSAGAGKIMAKLNVEKQSGKILADIIWTSEVPDFYQMKEEGILEIYKPTNFEEVLNPFDDYDGSFTAVRLGTLGIVININKIKDVPAQWSDVLGENYKNSFGIADPALSGTSYMSVALLEKQFGWDYIVKLHGNGATKSKGSGRVVEDVALGNLNACLGVDYITANKIDKGSPLKMIYPPELITVPSPVAILKSAPHKENAKKFIDYLLTQEAQQKIANSGTVPVRTDVKIPEKYNLPKPEDALKNGIKIVYTEILPKKDETIQKFSELFK